jgi:colicin import membrane protein
LLKAQRAAETQRAQAAARASEMARYTGQIRDKVRSNIVMPPSIQGNPEAEFEVTLIPTGEVINVRMQKSSGNAAYDYWTCHPQISPCRCRPRIAAC